MKKVILVNLQTPNLELSPARYQLLAALHARGFMTYIIQNGHLTNRKSYYFIDSVINIQNMSIRAVRKKIINVDPQILVASTYEDMSIVYLLPWIMAHTSFYYFNLEIYTPYLHVGVLKQNPYFYTHYKLEYPINKLKEILYTHKTKMFTIQDSLRAELSAKYFVKHKNTVFIPNSYIFEEFEIADEHKGGVIYVGGIKRDFLVEQFKNLRLIKNVPVTFSGWIDDWCRQEIKELRITNPNLVFKEQDLPIEEYVCYLQQFSIGLIWYSPARADEAHYYMGLSSGKMFRYLSMGMPVIAVTCAGITREVRKYKLGVVIDNISELESAYAEIMKNYSYYRENVIKTYKKRYDFSKRIIPLLDDMEKNCTESMYNKGGI